MALASTTCWFLATSQRILIIAKYIGLFLFLIIHIHTHTYIGIYIYSIVHIVPCAIVNVLLYEIMFTFVRHFLEIFIK